MEIKKTLIQILGQYLSGEISKTLLEESMFEILHIMLNGEIIKMRNLPYWGIVTELAEVRELDDFECKRIASRLLKCCRLQQKIQKNKSW